MADSCAQNRTRSSRSSLCRRCVRRVQKARGMEDFDVDALVGSSGSGNALFHAARMRAEENDVSLTRRVEQKVIVVAADEDYDGPTDDMTAANATEEKEGRASLVLKELPDMTPHNGVCRPMETFIHGRGKDPLHVLREPLVYRGRPPYAARRWEVFQGVPRVPRI